MPSRLLPPLTAAAVITGLAAVPSARAASPIKCDASAVRLSVAGAPAVEPATANRGAAACTNASSPTELTTPGLPLMGGVTAAYTTASGERENQRALATGGLTNVSIGKLSNFTLPDLSSQVPTVPPVTIPVPLALQALLGGSISVDVTAAVKDLAKSIALPDTTLLSAGAANAYAGASCAGGTLQTFGAPQVAGVKVLGQDIDPTGALNTAIQALDTQSIDLSKIDVTKVTLPKAVTDLGLPQATLTLLQNAIAPIVHALPPVKIPAQLAQVTVTPGAQTNSGGLLTQHALDVKIALLGQTLLDGTIGEARIGTSGVDCSPASTATPEPDATQLTLQCTTRRLVLTDVLQRGSRVKLVGAADKKEAGRPVAIKFSATGKTVARTTIGSDGSFQTSAALPPKRLRNSNSARYKAVLGSSSSLDLKLNRRMLVTSMTPKSGGKVTIKGRVTRPLGKPVQAVKVQRRVSCKSNETVKTVKPHSDGTFSVTVDGPTGQAAAVYRLATKVRKNTRNRKLYPTFTLPRGVNLKQ